MMGGKLQLCKVNLEVYCTHGVMANKTLLYI